MQPPDPHTEPGPARPARLLLWLRWCRLRHASRALLGMSSLRPLSILLCGVVIWGFIFGVSYAGFLFLEQQRLPLGGGIVGLLFDLLFLTLAGLLLLSSGLILYSSLFGSKESSFLLAGPVADDQLFGYHFFGAVAFSSWAFILLGAPILLAYGLVAAAPWYFYLLLLALFLGFVLIPGSAGAALCLLIVNFLPRRRLQVLVVLILAVVVGAVVVAWRALSTVREGNVGRDEVTRLLGRFDLAQAALLPSHWIAWGVRAAARGDLENALYYLALVWANGLFLYLVVAWLARRLYRRGYNRLATGGDLRRRYGGTWADRALERLLFFVDPQVKLLIIKDFRTFRRDPAQWAQILIFSGLMVIYSANVRRLFVQDMTWPYQNAISALNLGTVSLLVCTYTGRFIYPLLSLEGRKFWILGLLPLQRDRLLWGKFAFSTTGAVLIASGLVLLSDLVLGMPVTLVLLHQLTVIVLSAGLSGLSVGLGAMMPNFRETDPSKIASSFEGTLNLVIGLGFVMAILGLMAAPWHLLGALQEGPVDALAGWLLIGLGVAAGLTVGALAVVLPLMLGARKLRQMEF